MRKINQVEVLSQSEDDSVNPRRVIEVFAIYLYIFVLLLVGIATRYTWLNNLLRPHLPDWVLLVIGLSVPITLGLVVLRPIPWRIRVLFIFILPLQAALFGLVGEKYRYVQGAVTVFAFFEAYLILPEWNRRIMDKGNDGRVLHLEQGSRVGSQRSAKDRFN